MDIVRDSPKNLGYGTPIISGTWRAIYTHFCSSFTGSIGTKTHEIFGKSSRAGSQGLPKIFRAPIYKAHRIPAIFGKFSRRAVSKQ